ncbi:UNVERIFIED_ORG: hypothetical protein CLV66_103322 [Actinomadura viridilutea]
MPWEMNYDRAVSLERRPRMSVDPAVDVPLNLSPQFSL